MRLTLLFFAMCLATSGFSQLVLETEGSLDGFTTDTSIDYTFTVTNSSATDRESFYWQLVRADGMPIRWTFTVCDAVICYAEGQEGSICGDPQFTNVLSPGQSITFYKIGLHPNGSEGNSSVQFILTQECGNLDTDNVLAMSEVTFGVEQGVSSTNDEVLTDDLLIYPNPTVDRFKIKNDSGVESLAIYNIVGKQIMTSDHITGQSHDISDLDNGIYLVRMLDNTNQSLKVIRLTKD